jgi:hypothetical protein
MAIGANTGSRGGGSPHPGGHPAASPARPAHPAIGLSGVGSQAPAGAVAYGGGWPRTVGCAGSSLWRSRSSHWPPGSLAGRRPPWLGPAAMVSPRPSLAMALSSRLGRRRGPFTDGDVGAGLSLATAWNRTAARWLCRTGHPASDCVVPGAAELAAERNAR